MLWVSSGNVPIDTKAAREDARSRGSSAQDAASAGCPVPSIGPGMDVSILDCSDGLTFFSSLANTDGAENQAQQPERDRYGWDVMLVHRTNDPGHTGIGRT
jgi:hypothetical protein